MKTVILVAALSFCLWSCNNKKEEQNFGKPTEPVAVEAKSAEFPLAEKGAALFEGKGTCATCHKPDVKLIGPSLQDIAKTYKEKKASIAAFLNGELDHHRSNAIRSHESQFRSHQSHDRRRQTSPRAIYL